MSDNAVNQKRGYKTIHVYADSSREWNTSQWRCLTVSDALNTRPDLDWSSKLIHVSGFMNYLSPEIQELCGPCDLIIYERNVVEQGALDAIQYWRGLGKPVVVGLDDAYWMLPYSNPARPFWFDKPHLSPGNQIVNGGATLWLEKALREVDGLISPNRLLLNDYSHLTKNSYYLQNYAEARWWLNLPDRKMGRRWGPTWRYSNKGNVKREIGPAWRYSNDTWVEANPGRERLKKHYGFEDRIIIGWGGSMSHYDSFHGSGIFQAVERVTRRHPKILWMICGNDGRIVEQLPVSSHNKYHQGGVPPAQWPRIVERFDIGLAPLFGIYDQRRSWIKGIEYALAGVPWVGIEGETYNDLKWWECAKLGPETTEFWEYALEDMLKNLKQYQEKAIGLIELARQSFLASENLDVFADVYSKIIQDYSLVQRGLPGIVKVEGENGKTENSAKAIEPLPNIIRI